MTDKRVANSSSSLRRTRRDRPAVPGWKPLFAAPTLGVIGWLVAYWVASNRGATGGETNFGLMVFLPFMVGFWWFVLAGALLVLQSILLTLSRPAWPVLFAALATAVNVAGVAVLYGATLIGIGSDSWPSDGIAISVLLLAGLVALAPLAWLWRPVVLASRVGDGPMADNSAVV